MLLDKKYQYNQGIINLVVNYPAILSESNMGEVHP